ncbi:TPA: hypothetical protein ACOA2N_003422 [Vibrio cholerae]
MATNKTPGTLRRKVIEDKTKENKAAQSAAETTATVEESNTFLEDIQSGVELTASAVEDLGNTISDKLDDIQAGIELQIDGLTDINTSVKNQAQISEKISENIEKLGTLLKDKFYGPTTDRVVDVPPSSDEILKNLPLPVEDEPLTEQISKITQDIVPKPDVNPDDLPVPSGGNLDKKEDDKEPKWSERLAKIMKGGFKESYAVTNRIASMLFKYTISAAIFAAKWAAIILSVVLALDLIIIHFKYWGKLFKENFELFEEKLGPLAPILSSVFKTLSEIKKYFLEGDWGNLTLAILKGVGDLALKLVMGLEYALGKLGASILRALGKDDWADRLEATVIERYSANAGYIPTAEEVALVGRVRGQQLYDKYTTNSEMNIIGDGEAGRSDSYGVTLEEARKRANEYQKNTKGLESGEVTKETMIDDATKYFKRKSDFNALKRQAEDQTNNPENLKVISDKLTKLTDEIMDDPSTEDGSEMYNLGLEAADVAHNLYNKIPEVLPEEPKETQEAVAAETISKTEISNQETTNSTSQNNTQVNNISTNKTVINQRPVTNENVPGMYKAQEVN